MYDLHRYFQYFASPPRETLWALPTPWDPPCPCPASCLCGPPPDAGGRQLWVSLRWMAAGLCILVAHGPMHRLPSFSEMSDTPLCGWAAVGHIIDAHFGHLHFLAIFTNASIQGPVWVHLNYFVCVPRSRISVSCGNSVLGSLRRGQAFSTAATPCSPQPHPPCRGLHTLRGACASPGSS